MGLCLVRWVPRWKNDVCDTYIVLAFMALNGGKDSIYLSKRWIGLYTVESILHTKTAESISENIDRLSEVTTT